MSASFKLLLLLLQLCLVVGSLALLGKPPSQTTTASPSIFKHQPGYCEPFTLEFVAALLQRQVWEFLHPPLRPRQRQVRFDLYTRGNPNRRQVLSAHDAQALHASNFNAAVPTRLVIHGWNGQTNMCYNAAIKDAYLARGDFNLVLVDWSDYALNVNYVRVVLELTDVAAEVTAFTRLLHREKDVPFDEMYLVGHSAGCHVAGLAGKHLKPERYGVIYALDPGGPPHYYLKESWRLAPSDAMYVESIQTDATFGYPNADLAHATFFPNWGYGQPHCPNVTTNEPDLFCDHFAALYYFVESLERADAFGAWRCKDYQSFDRLQCGCGRRRCAAQVFMGGEPATPKRGVYYLSTKATRPFGYGGKVRMKRPIPQNILCFRP